MRDWHPCPLHTLTVLITFTLGPGWLSSTIVKRSSIWPERVRWLAEPEHRKGALLKLIIKCNLFSFGQGYHSNRMLSVRLTTSLFFDSLVCAWFDFDQSETKLNFQLFWLTNIMLSESSPWWDWQKSVDFWFVPGLIWSKGKDKTNPHWSNRMLSESSPWWDYQHQSCWHWCSGNLVTWRQ